MLNTENRNAYAEEHTMFRDLVRKVLDRELVPNHERFEREGIHDRPFWRALGEAGLLCPMVEEKYGGPGLDFRYNAVFGEELAYYNTSGGPTLQSDITAEYIQNFGTEEQKAKYLPKMVAGELITAIAMTEPGTGSDLQGVRTTARKDGDGYIVNGSKTYITNGQNADLVIVVAKTNPNEGSKGMSLILVESDRPGFARGRNLDKIGQHSADTSELFFNDVRVPASNILGEEGRGFIYLMTQLPQERLAIAVAAQASAQRAFDEAVKFTKERKAFGKTVFDFQNTRFVLAGMKAELQVGWAHLDWAITRHVAKQLTATEASAAKLWHSELLGRTADAALQLHGGAGYMNEYPIAQIYRDARVTRIFGGTSEIMKEVISRSI
ncbi:MAG: acyl-CoA dehydrogenase family protein [Hyphomonadaceae bacterium]